MLNSKPKGENAAVVQMGGPSAVFDGPLKGAVREFKNRNIRVLGARGGVLGIINKEFENLSEYSQYRMNQIARMPGAYLGTTKYHIGEKEAAAAVKTLLEMDIRYVLLIGGESSAGIAKNFCKAAVGTGIVVVHVPKTVDNDLIGDHTPGFPSAARMMAQFAYGLDHDNHSTFYDTPEYGKTNAITFTIPMGRNNSSIAAAGFLLRDKDTGPDLIFPAERDFEERQLIDGVEQALRRSNRGIHVIVPEGLQFLDAATRERKPVYEKAAKRLGSRLEGEPNLGGFSPTSGSKLLHPYFEQILQESLPGIPRVTSNLPGYILRSSPDRSQIDVKESEFVGREGAIYALDGLSGSVIIERLGNGRDYHITTRLVELDMVANYQKPMPLEFVHADGSGLTVAGKEYFGPLIGLIPGMPRSKYFLPNDFDFDRFCIPHKKMIERV